MLQSQIVAYALEIDKNFAAGGCAQVPRRLLGARLVRYWCLPALPPNVNSYTTPAC
jgi:hypothetical protein